MPEKTCKNYAVERCQCRKRTPLRNRVLQLGRHGRLLVHCHDFPKLRGEISVMFFDRFVCLAPRSWSGGQADALATQRSPCGDLDPTHQFRGSFGYANQRINRPLTRNTGLRPMASSGHLGHNGSNRRPEPGSIPFYSLWTGHTKRSSMRWRFGSGFTLSKVRTQGNPCCVLRAGRRPWSASWELKEDQPNRR